ncbi:YhdB family protein [Cytobacillus sp.]|uniref:YhdB family protein n=1 Tax=Cytobacillus sp. TaxID=2675269 RepID=UPI0028BD81BB|nr:YhdB family protein [Cytobacillus sp.]
MNKLDYDRALFYTHRSEWDNLLILMVRTEDQFLSKKIEHFLHAYHFEKDYSVLEKHLYSLLRYIDHAIEFAENELRETIYQPLMS